MAPKEQLAQLAERIERMALAPEKVEARWMWLARPFYRLLGWQPRYETEKLTALLSSLTSREGGDEALGQRVIDAGDELEGNVARGERACVVNGDLSMSHIAWLSRVARVVTRIEHGARSDPDARRALAAIDPMLVAQPLTVANASEQRDQAAEGASAERSHVRLVELQLAAIDHVIEAARAEESFMDRRRRLLEAARRLLLDADAALQLDADAVRLRQRYLAEQIVHVDRLEAAGLQPRVALLHQAKSALSRGDRARMHAALAAIEGFALASGDGARASRLAAVLDAETERSNTDGAEARRRSVERSTEQMFGGAVTKSVSRAYAAARERVEEELFEAKRQDAAHDREVAELALEYLAPGGDGATMSALLSVDGCFDVGAPLSPVRVRDQQTVARVVSHPTPELLLRQAQGPEDIPAAIIHDPRAVLLDLAAGRLLTRKYIHYEQTARERTTMVGEARVYVLDGSTSMMTDNDDMSRARMRDAILVAELATLIERFQNPTRFTRVVLFYRYFTKLVGPVVKVTNAEEALAAIGEVLSTPRRGGTNIEIALEASFEVIREARGLDPDLARAHVVLITDGDAVVRDEVVRRARESAGHIPIHVSVIALGQENPALRRLVAQQRARGERAFYHLVDDATLARLASGGAGLGRSIHLPSELERPPSESLRETLSQLLDEVDDLGHTRHSSAKTDGERALRDVASRDRRAVRLRYLRWFPALDAAVPPMMGSKLAATFSGEELDAAVVVLATVAEVIAELEGDPIGRAADAIDIVERLLRDARLSPLRFEELMRSGAEPLRDGIHAVHAATGIEVG